MLHESADVVQRLHASIILAPGTSAVKAVIVTQQELFVEHRAALSQPHGHANVGHTEPRHMLAKGYQSRMLSLCTLGSVLQRRLQLEKENTFGSDYRCMLRLKVL